MNGYIVCPIMDSAPLKIFKLLHLNKLREKKMLPGWLRQAKPANHQLDLSLANSSDLGHVD